MDKNFVAAELIKAAKSLVGRTELDDSYEDIAMDVASRIHEKGMSAQQAYNEIGYGYLYKHTREHEMPRGWETLPLDEMAEILTKSVDKAAYRYLRTTGGGGDRGRTTSSEKVARVVKYKGYTIEPSGINFYVKDPSGHRAFGEVPATIETAKKWIDMDINENRKTGKTAGGWPIKMVEKVAGFDAAFDDFLKHASMVLTDYMTKQFPTLMMPMLRAQEGGRYMKIIKEDSQKSVWAFVDKTNGDVLKPAGWNAPAKNARANVFDKGSWRNIGAYGPAYMRNMMSSELLKIAKELVGFFDEGELLEDIARAMRSVHGVDVAGVGANSNIMVTIGGKTYSIGTDEENLDFGSKPKFWVIDMDTQKQKAVKIDLTEDRDIARKMVEFIDRSF